MVAKERGDLFGDRFTEELKYAGFPIRVVGEVYMDLKLRQVIGDFIAKIERAHRNADNSTLFYRTA
jgi:hypothetical protein